MHPSRACATPVAGGVRGRTRSRRSGFTYHGFKGPDYRKKNARRIDFIFVRGNLQPVAAEILRDKVDGLYPSDHYFLMSDFIIQ